MKLLLATKNRHKTREIAAMLDGLCSICDLNDHPAILPGEETGTTMRENAAIKALSVSRVFSGLVLADDSGLEVDVLDGRPGVHSARYSGEGATDASNRRRLLEELRPLRGEHPLPTARFRCVLALAESGQLLATFEGTVEGRLAAEEKGSGGFGYDPLFIPEGFEKSFAELSDEVKNTCSHRARALSQAVAFLEQLPGFRRSRVEK
jgi:XTP/dITP diphosphohydrolase